MSRVIEVSQETAKDGSFMAMIVDRYGTKIPYKDKFIPRIDLRWNDSLATGVVVIVHEDGRREEVIPS